MVLPILELSLKNIFKNIYLTSFAAEEKSWQTSCVPKIAAILFPSIAVWYSHGDLRKIDCSSLVNCLLLALAVSRFFVVATCSTN